MSQQCDFSELEKKLGYNFSDIGLLKQALTHSSYANEIGLDRFACNERLEYLGDAVLEMTISELLYNKTPTLTEGKMTQLRAKLVCEESLSAKALELDFGSHLLLGRGEDKGGGRSRPSILADAFEAVTAAIYLDGGMECVTRFVGKTFAGNLSKPQQRDTDYKTLLQEHIQVKRNMTHSYKLISQEGPDHDKTFTAQVLINGQGAGIGTGKSKKSAEQAAAKEAIKYLKGED